MEEKSFEQKFNELAVFFNAAAHELRTPVTTGKIYLQLLIEQLGSDADPMISGNITKAEAQLNKLNQLIANILDVSRIYANKFRVACEPININEGVDNALRLKATVLSKHRLMKEGGIEHLVSGNLERITQILSNLIDNAVKFSKAGTTITIRLREANQKAIVDVIDEGAGIEPAHLTYIFNEDFKKRFSIMSPGLGISLFVAAAIAREMKGNITVESAAGKGSTFSLQLPIV